MTGETRSALSSRSRWPPPGTVCSLACGISAAIAGLLFEGWPARVVGNPALSRRALLGTAGAVAVIAGFALRAISLTATWTGDPPQLSVAVMGLNFIGAFVIVHAAVFRRWPLPAGGAAPAGQLTRHVTDCHTSGL